VVPEYWAANSIGRFLKRAERNDTNDHAVEPPSAGV
jgi:hypothetical protein